MRFDPEIMRDADGFPMSSGVWHRLCSLIAGTVCSGAAVFGRDGNP
jgi:hypothetical protein